jgi:hypothetical protein
MPHIDVEPTLIHKSNVKMVFYKEAKVSLEDKVYLETYYHHKPCQVQIDEIPQKSKYNNHKLQDGL